MSTGTRPPDDAMPDGSWLPSCEEVAFATEPYHHHYRCPRLAQAHVVTDMPVTMADIAVLMLAYCRFTISGDFEDAARLDRLADVIAELMARTEETEYVVKPTPPRRPPTPRPVTLPLRLPGLGLLR